MVGLQCGMSTAECGPGGRCFTVSMLAGEITVGPFGPEATIANLQEAVQTLSRIREVRVEALRGDAPLDAAMRLIDLPAGAELAAAAVPQEVVLDVGSVCVRAGFVGDDCVCLRSGMATMRQALCFLVLSADLASRLVRPLQGKT